MRNNFPVIIEVKRFLAQSTSSGRWKGVNIDYIFNEIVEKFWNI